MSDLKSKRLSQAVSDLEGVLSYLRSYNPSVQDRIDMAYVEKKITPVLAMITELDKLLSETRALLTLAD